MVDADGSGVDRSVGVLICDDVEALRRLFSLIVEERDGLHVVGEAQDGAQAIEQARRLQPDVILLDIAMPVRSGLSALPEIKAVAPSARVIVLSGFADSILAADALSAGADRYIEKGVDPRVIADAIELVVVETLAL